MVIRPAAAPDRPAIAGIIMPVIRAGTTYAIDRAISEEAALDYWLAPDRQTFVVETRQGIVGTYYLRANQSGGGAHVANCGFMTHPAQSGRGVARQMCEHALDAARSAGFRAMQFNFVVSTNLRAIRLWEGMGFAVVGRLPGAFRHPELGYVDALVMFRDL